VGDCRALLAVAVVTELLLKDDVASTGLVCKAAGLLVGGVAGEARGLLLLLLFILGFRFFF